MSDGRGATTATARWPGGQRLSDGRSLYWWFEIVMISSIYLVYSAIRNAGEGTTAAAYDNALRIIDLQEVLRLNHELAWQEAALAWRPLIIVSNYFYGSAYVIVTIGSLAWLFVRCPDVYPRWRNTLVFGTLLALIGFYTFPLMPPRLLDTVAGPGTFGFVDTLRDYPTFWSFQSEVVESISNQYAAMPSLHCGFALWACAALVTRVRTPWARIGIVGYVVATIVVVVITGNHFFIDAVGGAVVMAAGYGLAVLVDRVRVGSTSPAQAEDLRAEAAD